MVKLSLTSLIQKISSYLVIAIKEKIKTQDQFLTKIVSSFRTFTALFSAASFSKLCMMV